MAEKMTCPSCGKRAGVHHQYTVKGLRYSSMPGRVRVYRCECGQEVRSIEITVDRLTAGLDLYQENIQRHIRKNAELKEKLDWMKRPVNMRQHKIERLRAKIIELLDITF